MVGWINSRDQSVMTTDTAHFTVYRRFRSDSISLLHP
jgi:hypothetical protein